MEIWKQTKYPNYEVSSKGRIRNIKTKRFLKGWLLKSKQSNQEYIMIQLYVNNPITLLLHRLIAETFIPNPDNKPTVNHKNGIGLDNNLNNLEWATYSEQIWHSHDNKLHNQRKRVLNIDLNKEFESVSSAGRWLNETKFGFTKNLQDLTPQISKCCRGVKKICYGYRWKFID